MKNYQVWVTLQEWDGDDHKICDAESTLLGTSQDKSNAKMLYDTTVAHGLIVKDTMPFNVYDKGYGDGFADAKNENEIPRPGL